MKKQLLATLAAGLTGFFAGWIIYGIALMDFMTANSTNYEGLMKDEPAIWVYALANIATASLLTMIFDKWAKITSFKDGFIQGAIIGFLVVFSYDIVFWGTMNWFNNTALLLDIVAGTAIWGLTGGVAALVLGKVKE